MITNNSLSGGGYVSFSTQTPSVVNPFSDDMYRYLRAHLFLSFERFPTTEGFRPKCK